MPSPPAWRLSELVSLRRQVLAHCGTLAAPRRSDLARFRRAHAKPSRGSRQACRRPRDASASPAENREAVAATRRTSPKRPLRPATRRNPRTSPCRLERPGSATRRSRRHRCVADNLGRRARRFVARAGAAQLGAARRAGYLRRRAQAALERVRPRGRSRARRADLDPVERRALDPAARSGPRRRPQRSAAPGAGVALATTPGR